MMMKQTVRVWTVEPDGDGETYRRYMDVDDVDVQEDVLGIQQNNSSGNGFIQTCIPLWNVKRFDVGVTDNE